MIDIVKATINDCDLLSKISKQCFIESHGNSASKEDIEFFTAKNYSKAAFNNELQHSENKYHIIYVDNELAGYSKIVFDVPNENIQEQHVTKLDRLYLLKAFYGQNLGVKLLDFNIALSKRSNQKGVWLAVWVENVRAIHFYKKIGFEIVGAYNFKISETHSNPNHIVYLEY
ncbi:Acetyltransferase (GNAT) family protein [Lutibacter agarilyticus]|uniref:Acetyltransferase (GNAT) family protein n=1 Tax=Lutibacter agarilyticus TaxID=1109740 RepID=A0A238YN27_9FLAO|nr:GNAT family N-acetyltransferase [Lutibacter agarilyticus]SNR72392.1 Acetyltransferase (GNAT) family protein [Lutibacter agarilyticus]